MNTVILFIVLNVALGLFYHLYDARLARDPNRIFLKYPNSVLLQNIPTLFPTMTKAEVAQLLSEEYRTWQTEWFTGFSEAPFHGKYVNVSEYGFRVGADQGPWPPVHDGKNFVVFLFGGSTAFSYGETDDQALGSRLQPLLAKKLGRPVSVYNFGQSSYFSTQERILFEQLILSGQKPDMVIFLDGLNDFHWVNAVMPASPDAHPVRPEPPTWRSVVTGAVWLLPMGRLAVSMRNALQESAHRKSPDDLKVLNTNFDDPKSLQGAIDRYFTNKRLIEAEAKEYSIKTLFVWEPAPTYEYDLKYDPFITPELGFTGFTYTKYGYPMLRDEVARTHPDNFLWCADLQKDLHELLYVDEYHYSPKMTDIIAGCMVDGVK
jgi:lysophospholipase L1-like esterase